MNIRCPLTDTECQKETYEQDDPYLIVLGLQFKSQHYDFTALCERLSKAVENAKLDLSNDKINIKFEALKFDEDTHIDCSICQNIQKSSIQIFEMSDWNPNVMIECGFSIGLNKKPILIRNRKGKDLPTDFSGLYRKSYDNADDLVHEISSKIVQRVREKNEMKCRDNFELLYLKEPVRQEFHAELNKREINEEERFITSVIYRGLIIGGFFDNKIIKIENGKEKKTIYWDPDPNTYKIKDGTLLNPRIINDKGQMSPTVPGILFGNVEVRSNWKCTSDLPKGKYKVEVGLYQNQLDRIPARDRIKYKEIILKVI